MIIADILEGGARAYPHRPAVSVVAGEEFTYQGLRDRVARFAGGLGRLGVGLGDRVALIANNGVAFFDTYLACAYLGAIAVPIGIRLTEAEVAAQLQDARPTLVVADQALMPLAEATAPEGTKTVVVGGPNYRQALNGPAVDPRELSVHGETACLMIYTSGTTGRPKGVCLTQRSVAANAVSTSLAQQLGRGDVFLTMTPLYHAASAARVVGNLLDGQTHVVLPEFTVEGCLRAIEAHEVTVLFGVATQLRRIMNRRDLIDGCDLRSLRLVCYGAMPTSPHLIEEVGNALDCDMHHAYGLTEATSLVTSLRPDDHYEAWSQPEGMPAGAIGRPAPGIDARIVREDGSECDVNEVGEIRVTGDLLMAGYWSNGSISRDAIRNGWLRTGDLAYRGKDGCLFLAGRMKELIISGGVNVFPMEIERVIAEHDSILEAAVIGEANEEWGEVPVAYVMTKVAGSLDEENLREHCAARLSGPKVPKRFIEVQEFPRTGSGKVRKTSLGHQTRNKA